MKPIDEGRRERKVLKGEGKGSDTCTGKKVKYRKSLERDIR